MRVFSKKKLDLETSFTYLDAPFLFCRFLQVWDTRAENERRASQRWRGARSELRYKIYT